MQRMYRETCFHRESQIYSDAGCPEVPAQSQWSWRNQVGCTCPQSIPSQCAPQTRVDVGLGAEVLHH